MPYSNNLVGRALDREQRGANPYGFTTGTSNPNASPLTVSNTEGITRAEWQHFMDFYAPREQDAINSAMQTDFGAEGDKAGQQAAAGIASGAGTLERNFRRAGIAVSAEERAALSRRTNTARTTSVARAENTTRRGLSDARTNLLTGIVNIGRGVASTANAGAQSVADMAAQREAQYQQQLAQYEAQRTSNNLSMLGTAASLAIAFI